MQGALEFRAASASPHILDCGANVSPPACSSSAAIRRANHREADPTLSRSLAPTSTNGASDVDGQRCVVDVGWPGDVQARHRLGMIDDSPAVDGSAIDVLVSVSATSAPERIDLLKLDIKAPGTPSSRLRTRARSRHRDRDGPAGSIHLSGRLPRPELLTCGVVYAVDEFVPQPWRPPVSASVRRSQTGPWSGR